MVPEEAKPPVTLAGEDGISEAFDIEPQTAVIP
jgi:hypothetical protein